MAEPHLGDTAARLLLEARRAVLTTIDARDGRPRSVPICFVVVPETGRPTTIYSPLDDKPKSSDDPRTLGRVKNLAADPRASLLVDRWDEDWARLAWLRLDVEGRLVEPGEDGHAAAVAALREKYTQYRSHDLPRRPMLRFDVVGGAVWTASDANVDDR